MFFKTPSSDGVFFMHKNTWTKLCICAKMNLTSFHTSSKRGCAAVFVRRPS